MWTFLRNSGNHFLCFTFQNCWKAYLSFVWKIYNLRCMKCLNSHLKILKYSISPSASLFSSKLKKITRIFYLSFICLYSNLLDRITITLPMSMSIENRGFRKRLQTSLSSPFWNLLTIMRFALRPFLSFSPIFYLKVKSTL